MSFTHPASLFGGINLKMIPSAIILIPLVLCSCAQQRQENVASRSEDKPDALFPVKMEGGQFGYMDRSGRVALKGPFAGAQRFSEGLAAVQLTKAGKVG